ncbi:hypothetical protein EmuJ_000099500 [Echinococcus multilocularis]|uniref:Uncharacterized protein n=1 Tax=Echinococcus multilocularis TaxID=6211 RepID=A0A087VY57_ECHMU|nr:hypothetical protein EmuJ_000099500 [Echinococcus multilocularis]
MTAYLSNFLSFLTRVKEYKTNIHLRRHRYRCQKLSAGVAQLSRHSSNYSTIYPRQQTRGSRQSKYNFHDRISITHQIGQLFPLRRPTETHKRSKIHSTAISWKKIAMKFSLSYRRSTNTSSFTGWRQFHNHRCTP